MMLNNTTLLSDDVGATPSPMRRQWVAFQTILRKEVVRFMRIWVQTLLPPVMTMALYFLIFGHFIGQRIGHVSGMPYATYIAPGLIMMAVITNAYVNVCSSLFSAKFQRSIEEMLVSPMSPYTLLSGYVVSGMLRGLVTGVLVLCVALLFVRLPVAHLGLIMLVILFSSLLFSLAGFINALYAKTFDDVSIVPTFVLTPLTYFGGVFYSIHMLPDVWQKISYFNPIVYMVNIFRYGFLGVSDVNVWLSVGVMLGICGVLAVVSVYLLKNGVGIRE